VTSALLRLNARTFASLRRHRNYRLYFAGQVISLSGTWMQNIALAWLVLRLTHSPVAIGLLAFFRFAPFSVFALPAGVLADRFDNRRTMMLMQAVSMAISAALAGLVLTGQAVLWEVYVLAVLAGTAAVFDAPNRHALTFQMVGRDELPNAVALNASLFNGSRVIGPAIGGVVIAAAGVGVCFAINAVSFLAVLGALALMRKRDLYPLERREAPRMLAGARHGLGYVWRTPSIRLVLIMTTVVSTVGFNFHVLVPVLASKTLHVGAEVFGALGAAFGAGALVGALLAASLGRASWKATLLGSAGFSTTLLALAAEASVWPIAVLLFLTGVFFTTWTANSQSIIQLTAPDHLRGRVLSIYLFAFGGFAPLGGLLAGWLSDVGGTRLAFFVAGIACLAMTGYAFLAWPRLTPTRSAGEPAEQRLAA
jgi:MFS family permease